MSTTGTLDVVAGGTTKTYSWNGNVKDRAVAKAAFTEAVLAGGLAIVQDSPGKARQVRSFREVEQAEQERGEVSVQVSPALVGG